MQIMAVYGQFQFGLETSCYQEIRRITEYKWAENTRIGGKPASQYTGGQLEKIELSGFILPSFKGGLNQMQVLREIAQAKKPQTLTISQGNNATVLGKFTVQGITETGSNFIAGGAPRRIDFAISLKEYV